jgi:hypothetical protein
MRGRRGSRRALANQLRKRVLQILVECGQLQSVFAGKVSKIMVRHLPAMRTFTSSRCSMETLPELA